MKTPVIISCGHTFQKDAIAHILKTTAICPLCKQKFQAINPNYAIRSLIQNLKTKYTQAIQALKQNCINKCNQQVHWVMDCVGYQFAESGHFNSYEQIMDVVGAASSEEISYFSKHYPSDRKAHMYAGYRVRQEGDIAGNFYYQPQKSIQNKYFADFQSSAPCYSCYSIFQESKDQIQKLKDKLKEFEN